MGKSTPFLYQKRGVFYLQKRVPKKLVPKVGKAFVRVSLRTKDRTTAIQTAGSILNALDKEWHAALFAIPDDIQLTGFLSAQPARAKLLTIIVKTLRQITTGTSKEHARKTFQFYCAFFLLISASSSAMAASAAF